MLDEANTAVEDQVSDDAAQAEDAQAREQLQQYIDERAKGKSSSDTPADDATGGKSDEAKGTEQTKAAEGSDKTDEKKDSEQTPAEGEQKTTLTIKQMRAAKHLGFSQADIDAMMPEVAKALEGASSKLRSKERELGRLEQKLQRQLDTSAPAGEGDDSDESATDDGEAEKGGDRPPASGEFQEMSPDDSAEEIAAKYNALLKHTQRLQERVDGLEDASDESADEEVAAEVEKFFKALDTKTYSQFGEGDVEKGTPEHAARQKLISKAEKIMALHEADGEDATVAQCLEDALALVAKDEFKKAAQKEVQDKIDERDKKSVAKPGGTASLPKKVDEEEQGRENLRQWAHEHGREMK